MKDVSVNEGFVPMNTDKKLCRVVELEKL